MADSTKTEAPGVLPGEYFHYKQQKDTYSVHGTARPYAAGDVAVMSFTAVLSGTEDENPQKVLRFHHLDDGVLAYENAVEGEFTGLLVVYVPNYGKRLKTFRTIEEFTEEVPGHGPRFRPVEKDEKGGT